jgi:hypothetical protein
MSALMQRCKQLGAHEVGHTLGLAHNFAGSISQDGPASVMDYPPPIITIDSNGDLVLNAKSYSDKIGAFDKIAIDYGYRIFDSDEDYMLEKLIDDAESNGYVFLTGEREKEREISS